MILPMGHVLVHSYREACSVLGHADTRLPDIKTWFMSYPERAALCVPVPSHSELLEIEDARSCLAQLHIVRLNWKLRSLRDLENVEKRFEAYKDDMLEHEPSLYWMLEGE